MINRLDEQKHLIKVHMMTQGIPRALGETILGKIENPDGANEGSWVMEFSRVAEKIGMDGERERNDGRYRIAQRLFFQAATLYSLACFPFPRISKQQEALSHSIKYFSKGAALVSPAIRSITVPLEKGKGINIYLAIPEVKEKIPVILASGGIVSHKEQWHKLLHIFPHIGFAICVMDGPGVGESPYFFRNGAEKLYRQVITFLSSQPQVDPSKIIILGISFGGYWAVKTAALDERIKGVIAIAAPIHHFFVDTNWWNQLPITTKETFKFVTGLDNEDMLKQELKKMSLEYLELLKAVNIPVIYFGSTNDSICPIEDAYLVRERIKASVTKIYNDEHALPHYLSEVWLFSIQWLSRNFLIDRWFQKGVVALALPLIQLINFLKNLRRLYL